MGNRISVNKFPEKKLANETQKNDEALRLTQAWTMVIFFKPFCCLVIFLPLHIWPENSAPAGGGGGEPPSPVTRWPPQDPVSPAPYM